MIIIKVRNGIGNQLFIYAFGEYLKSRYPEQNVRFDISELPLYVNGRYTVSLSSFVEGVEPLSPAEVREHLGKILYFKRYRSNSKSLICSLERIIVGGIRIPRKYEVISEPMESGEKMDAFVEKMLKMQLDEHKNYVFDGFWEDIRYVEPVKELIKTTISFPGVTISSKFEDLVKGRELVSVHIRRGDYIKESFATEYPRYFYAYCDEDYYSKAIERIEQQVNNPFYVFFSDDTDYVNRKYNFLPDKIVVMGQKDYEDLYFMTLCKHHIIANSTFSFWGAYLAKEKGITIAPDMHYSHLISSDKQWSKRFFIVPEWQYLEVKAKV